MISSFALLMFLIAGVMVFIFVKTLQTQEMKISSDITHPKQQAALAQREHAQAFSDAMQRADLAYEEGKLHDAEAALESALRLDPDNEVVLGKLAFILEQQGDMQAAQSIYERALEIHQHAPSLYGAYAALLHKLGKLDEAKEAFIKAIDLETDSAVIYYNFAQLLEELDEKQAAIQGYEEALRLDSQFEEAQARLDTLRAPQ